MESWEANSEVENPTKSYPTIVHTKCMVYTAKKRLFFKEHVNFLYSVKGWQLYCKENIKSELVGEHLFVSNMVFVVWSVSMLLLGL